MYKALNFKAISSDVIVNVISKYAQWSVGLTVAMGRVGSGLTF